ncbi:hypothetical protein L249_8115 [Ophiocordyceps polyrhachis-furcata BCC 54312]|uniref:NADH dehydrogenase [ubiquinone] iron-sulfur protein 5 n=1 Tax=Ophiocordyceps polyrhachis-furcata BCC 54312 TaxID=1330021 RepID=A0A367LH51_9HYPO|nr:hypothetical protein L249_8115 [Ophiocordyceps polyrhachis-furcata BCC 54312]
MASGYGMHGGPGRCFPFWQDVLACYVVNTSTDNDSGKKKCALPLEDYYECLHHKKEHVKALALQAALKGVKPTAPVYNEPDAKHIKSLGLVGNNTLSENT